MLSGLVALLASNATSVAAPVPAPQAAIGTELQGRTTISKFPDGSTVQMDYRPDGTFTGRLGEHVWSGRYWLTGGKLCLRTSDELECWPYPEAMVPGRTYDVTAPDGTRVKVTLSP